MFTKIFFFVFFFFLFSSSSLYAFDLKEITNDYVGFVCSENIYSDKDAFVLYAFSKVVNKKGNVIYKSFSDNEDFSNFSSSEILNKYIKKSKNINQRCFGLTMFNVAVLKDDVYGAQLLLEAGAFPYEKIDIKAVSRLSQKYKKVLIDNLIGQYQFILGKKEMGFYSFNRKEKMALYKRAKDMSYFDFKRGVFSIPFVGLINLSNIKNVIKEVNKDELIMLAFAENVDINGVAVQIEKNVNVNFTSVNGDNIIQILLKQKKVSSKINYITQKAINAGLDVLQRNNDNVSLFYMVYKKRKDSNMSGVWDVVSSAAASNPESLISAISMNRDVLTDLLKKGLAENVNYQSDQGTPLTVAVELNKRNAVRLLLENGADPNLANVDGDTPLFLALTKNFSGITDDLIKAGAVDGMQSAESLVMIAAKRGNVLVLKQLVAAGANLDVNVDELLNLIMSEEDGLVAFLIAKGLKISDDNINEYLLRSVVSNKILNARSFITFGADVNIKNEDGKSLVEFATTQEMKDLLSGKN